MWEGDAPAEPRWQAESATTRRLGWSLALLSRHFGFALKPQELVQRLGNLQRFTDHGKGDHDGDHDSEKEKTESAWIGSYFDLPQILPELLF